MENQENATDFEKSSRSRPHRAPLTTAPIVTSDG